MEYAELFVAALIFASTDLFSFLVSYISESVLVLSLIIAVLFISIAVEFVLSTDGRNGNASKISKHRLLTHALFAAIVVSYLILFALNPLMWVSVLKNFWIFGVFFVAFLPLFFMMFFGSYLVRDGQRKAVILLLVVFLVLVLYYSSQVLVSGIKADDEELIMFQSLTTVLHGGNPYNVSFYDFVYQNVKNAGFTLTTTSSGLMGTMAYPDLFFISFIPFYLVSSPTVHNFVSIDLPLEESVFLFILMLTMAFLLDKKSVIKPKLSLLVLFVFVLTNSASVTVYLMIALLLIAYVKLDSRYSWIVLGICASIQEELWLPVLFLIVYSFNNKGVRRGLINTAGTAAVFLAINAYFIVFSPAAYYSSVFGPLNSFIFPNGFSSIGLAILKFFPMLLSTYSLLFEATTLLLAFILVYWNRKELIPIFSMIPFLVLDHSLYSYYAAFIFIFIFAIAVMKKKEKGWMEAALKRRKPAVFCAIAAFFVLILIMMYSSHVALEKSFGISASPPELLLNASGMYSTYRTTLSYHNLSNYSVYVVAVAMNSEGGIGFLGVINSSIISTPVRCVTYQCMVNINEITLPRNGSTYDLNVTLKWANDTPIEYAAVELYNGAYFYSGKEAYNASS